MNDSLLDTLIPLAQHEARQGGHKYVRAEHLLLALLQLPRDPAYALLQAQGVDYATLAGAVRGLPCPVCAAEPSLELANGAQRALQSAQALAGAATLHGGHILSGIVQVSPLVRSLLTQVGVELPLLFAQPE
jgi:ATP-dependent Clp protease ATP-binding subunit ClpA